MACEAWLEKLETACRTGRWGIRDMAITCREGPVLEVINSVKEDEDWPVLKKIKLEDVSLRIKPQCMWQLCLMNSHLRGQIKIYEPSYINIPSCTKLQQEFKLDMTMT